MSRPPLRPRSDYSVFCRLTTRWADDDVYGHVSNTVHNAWFDTTVNTYLVEQGGLDLADGAVIGMVVESGCRYANPLAFPGDVEIGLKACPPGTSSVRYELGVFAPGAADAAADGFFVKVFVDRETRRPVASPPVLRRALERVG